MTDTDIRRAERIENAINAYAAATDTAERKAAFRGLCEWVGDGRDLNGDASGDEKEARALLAARGFKTTLRYADC